MLAVWLQQLLNGVMIGSVYALVAIGLTMVYGVLRILHFAHGAVYTLAAYAAVLLLLLRFPLVVAIPLAMLGAACAGVVIEFVVYRPLRGASPLVPLISGVALYFLAEDLFRHLGGAYSRPFPAGGEPAVYSVGSVVVSSTQMLVFAVVLVLVTALRLFIGRTRAGLAMEAIAQDATMAAACGIPVNRIISLNFAIGSALAGAAGILIGLYFNAIFPTMGIKAVEKAFAVVILGGLGSVGGSILAAMLLGVGESLVIGFLDLPLARDAMAFVLLLLVLIFRPTGLFGLRVAKV